MIDQLNFIDQEIDDLGSKSSNLHRIFFDYFRVNALFRQKKSRINKKKLLPRARWEIAYHALCLDWVPGDRVCDFEFHFECNFRRIFNPDLLTD